MNEDDESTLAEPPTRGGPTPGPRRTGDRYRVTTQIGRGGMGEVLDAFDEQIGRDVAIKRMRSQAPSDNQIRRFLREAKIQGQLEHPAIVPVHDLGRDTDGRPYFAMKKLTGLTLSSILDASDERKFPRQRLLRAFTDVCLAIELAHTRGIVHRDLKPDNLMLGDFGETYVLDWGVAKVVGETDDALIGLASGEHGTAAGVVIGTPGYMSPEQARGDLEITAMTDVYALGCVLFEILTGERMHPRDVAFADLRTQPSLRAPDRDIPPELDALVVRATRIDPRERVPSARELGDSVQRYLDGDRDLAQRRQLAAQHLELALVAFTSEDRSTAMREAGRALALDPQLHRAGELITRLMLEPPREVPPGVSAEIARDSVAISRRNSRVGAITNLGYLLFLPLWLATGGVSFAFMAGFVCMIAMVFGLLWRISDPRVAFVIWPVILLNASMTTMVGVVSSPLLLGIPLAAVSAVGIMGGRELSRWEAFGAAALLCASVLAPWSAERVGLLPISASVGDGVLALHAPMFVSEPAIFTLFVFATISIVTVATLLTRNIRATEQATRKTLHLQAWQLRQLVA